MSASRKETENKLMSNLIDGKGRKADLRPAYEQFIGQTEDNIKLAKKDRSIKNKKVQASFEGIFDVAENAMKTKKPRTIYFDLDVYEALKPFNRKMSQIVNDSMRKVLEDQGLL